MVDLALVARYRVTHTIYTPVLELPSISSRLIPDPRDPVLLLPRDRNCERSSDGAFWTSDSDRTDKLSRR